MCADMGVDVRAGMCAGMCVDMCTHMCTDVRVDKQTGMCHGHVYRRACRYMDISGYRHGYRHVC